MRTLPDLRAYFEGTAAAQAAQEDGGAGLVAGDAPECILGAVGRAVVDRGEQVPGLQPRLLGWAADVEVADHDARLRQTELARLIVREVLGHDADPAADDAPVRDDLAQDPAHHVDRDRKADALDADVLGDDGGVDAYQRPGRIHQGTAGVAEVDGSIGLNEVLERSDAQLLAAGGADDAVRHRL